MTKTEATDLEGLTLPRGFDPDHTMVRAGPEGLEVVFREGARTLEWTKAEGVGPYGLELHLWAAPGIVPLAEELADRGIQVVLAGLDLDFRGEPFGPVPKLLARAESVTKLAAVCVRCGPPGTATPWSWWERANATRPVAGPATRCSAKEEAEDGEKRSPCKTSTSFTP